MNQRLVSETALDKGETELILTTEQAQNADATLLRRFAAASESNEINGKSTRLEIIHFVACQRTLWEYTE